ncbi:MULTISPECIES: hypothetical protein [Halolamina]|uniref:Uncharacterized protein n=1 Tax=Halolamina pelagica TaxID=699431 RepID=A0A1I5NHH1_9EURY|nr:MULTISPECIES: hypothetical protein [Halolamina]NHX36317.1 hypothetical protein [Halolamina sp. R1-12]SFP21248.1 hypothetical protein SAMN05216277_10229 [Halolamina pelagica]
MSDSPPDTDEPTDPDEPTAPPADDEEIDRRRLIRWIALIAFGIPVVVEVLTFANIIDAELLGGDDDDPTETGTATPTDRPDAVGVGDELLPETAASETITTSEIRAEESSRTYVFGVEVENDTDATVEIRTRHVRLRDGERIDGVSSTGSIEPGSSGTLTAAWQIPEGSMPGAVEVVALRDGGRVFEDYVTVERPPIVG